MKRKADQIVTLTRLELYAAWLACSNKIGRALSDANDAAGVKFTK